MGMVKNKKIRKKYVYHKIFKCGIELKKSEVYSIHKNDVDISGAICKINKSGELIMEDSKIESKFYSYNYNNTDEGKKIGYHVERRDRKLLISKKELRYITNYCEKYKSKFKKDDMKIIPISLYVDENSMVKVNISIVKDKEKYDKRIKIKKEDLEKSKKTKKTKKTNGLLLRTIKEL